ncbi:MAG: cell wall-binding repeat-containing protein [Coriobacteriales bacterium]|jgi:putative cell wall-binding protein/GH25 family lysozyme M1 (1,4-beta-N-acetylmuramidase)
MVTRTRILPALVALACAVLVAAAALVATPRDAQAASAITYTLSPGSSSAKIRSIAGAGHNETAAKIAKWTYPKGVKSKTAIIASGATSAWPDAMSASPLAGALDCPILYTAKSSVPSVTLSTLKTLGVKNVIIVGGTKVVGNPARAQLESAGMDVMRLAGANMQATQLAIYKYGVKNGLWNTSNAIVATGNSFADALSVSPIAVRKKYPIFITSKKGNFSKAQLAALKGSDITRFVIVGGTKAIPATTEKRLETIADANAAGSGTVERVWGANAFKTSAAVAQWGVQKKYLAWNKVAFARGYLAKDALAGGVLQGKVGAPLLLIEKSHEEVLASVKGKGISSARVFGGYKAVTQAVREDIARALGFPFSEIQGHPIKLIPDISLWNEITDMNLFMKSSEFVFIKCTQGTNIVDPRYNERVKQLNASKVPHWDYTFMLKGNGTVKYAEQQVQYLINHSNGAVGLVLDVEWYKGGDETLPTLEQVNAAVRYATKRGYKVVIYYNNSMNPAYRLVAFQSDIRAKCATWAASWGKNSGGASAKPDSTCDVHQYTSTGTMPGVKGDCDLSVFYGTTKSLAWFKKK